jgi:HlyD family secretion protein
MTIAPHLKLLVMATALICVLLPPTALRSGAQEATRAKSDIADRKNWQAVAPGRVEPRSGELRIASPMVARVAEVLVKPNDSVFAGEILLRLDDDEVRTRWAKADLQVALRKRARPAPQAKDAARRKFEDAAADAETAVIAARVSVDRAALARRKGGGSEDALAAARKELARAEQEREQRRVELAKFEADAPPLLPTELEGQFAMARVELRGAAAALDNLNIRAPSDGSILQVNVRAGELASPTAPAALIVLGDVSALRVRAEIDERDYGDIKVGHPVVVRAAGFRGRDVTGKVSAIAPIVEPGRLGARGQRNLTDVNVAEVVIDLDEAGPLAVGMKVDVFFRRDGVQR